MATETEEVAAVETQHIDVPAREASIGWLNALLAASDDDSRPALYRTLSLEFFADGLHLIGCNGHALFRSWVPAEEGAVWPELDEAPDRQLVAMDPDGFAKAFVAGLVRVTKDEDRASERMTISTSTRDEDAGYTLGAEFQRERLTLRAAGQRLDLPIYEAAYPDWRRLRLDDTMPERVSGMMFDPHLLALIGKLRGGYQCSLDFHGDSKHVAFRALGEVETRGIVMPLGRVSTRGEG